MNKQDIEKQEEQGLIALVDQSGVETAIDKLIAKNNALLPDNAIINKIKNSAGLYIASKVELMNLPKDEKLKMLYNVLSEARVGCEAGVDYDIIPFKGKPVVIRNKRGWFKLVRLIVEAPIVGMRTGVVFKDDEFSYNNFTGEIHHVENINNQDKYSDIVGAWAYIELADGFKHSIFMNKAKIENIRKASPSGGSAYSPWTTFPSKMVETKIMKEMAKYLNTLFGGNLDYNTQKIIENDEKTIKSIDNKGNIVEDKTVYEVEVTNAPEEVDLENL